MSISEIHHLNYLVRDIDQFVKIFSLIFKQKPQMDTLPGRNVITARYDLSGTYFILVQPLSDEGPVAAILREQGEGLFLLSFTVDDLEQEITLLEQNGIAVNRDSLREGIDGWTICDLVQMNDTNTILQLCELNRTT